MIYKFEMGERVQLRHDDVKDLLPASGRGVIVRRYVEPGSGGLPEYVVRFDHEGSSDEDWDVHESMLEKEHPL